MRLAARQIIVCTGGVSRRLDVPGFELTATHSDAWSLTSVPPSMIVVGAGATGVQVASIFNAFGTRVQLFQAGAAHPRRPKTRTSPLPSPRRSASPASSCTKRSAPSSASSRPPTACAWSSPRTARATASTAALAVARRRLDRATPTGSISRRAGVDTDARGFVARRRPPAHVGAARLRRRRRHRPADARAASAAGRVRRRDQRGPRRDDHDGDAVAPDRQLHGSRVRAGRADRSERPRDARRRSSRPCASTRPRARSSMAGRSDSASSSSIARRAPSSAVMSSASAPSTSCRPPRSRWPAA